jgi:ABC-type antimicrobial peptide transport system permease subunit
VKLPDEIMEGHFSKSNLNGFVFEPHYQLITGREPASFEEILISESLSRRLGYDNPINKTLYLSFPIKEDVLTNGFISREYETVELKITGITDSGKIAISHMEEWSILFFQVMLGVSTFDLRINNLAIRINDEIESQLMVRLNRAFPTLSITSPLKDIKNSIEKICGYIELIMLVASITSIVIAGLILFICNHIHYEEAKKDIGLVRCLGVNEKESRKFVYCHSFTMAGLSLLFSSVELIFVSLVLSEALSGTLMIESMFVFNPISLLYMLLLAVFISLVTSIFISMKTKKLNALECLQ